MYICIYIYIYVYICIYIYIVNVVNMDTQTKGSSALNQGLWQTGRQASSALLNQMMAFAAVASIAMLPGLISSIS